MFTFLVESSLDLQNNFDIPERVLIYPIIYVSKNKR